MSTQAGNTAGDLDSDESGGLRGNIRNNADFYVYQVSNKQVTIAEYNGDDDHVSIPDSAFGLPVTAIGEGAFADKQNLFSVAIPDSVTSIGDSAFEGCDGLKIVRLGRNLQLIGEESFKDCNSLENIFLPESISGIGDNAFAGCGQFQQVYFLGGPANSGSGSFPASSTIFYRESAPGWENVDNLFVDFNKVMLPTDNAADFYYVIKHDEVTIARYKEYNHHLICVPATIEGYPVVNIADYAFSYSMMDRYNPFEFCGQYPGMRAPYTVILPDGIRRIGKNAFLHCDLMIDCNLPEQVSFIGPLAFSGSSAFHSLTLPAQLLYAGECFLSDCSSLVEIKVDPGNAYYSSEDGVLFNKDKSELLQFPIGRLQEHYTVPSGVTHIRAKAFAGCKLQSITLPDSLINIGAMAFSECYNLTEIKVPNSVTQLGAKAFSGCENLQSITLGTGLARIEMGVFFDCYSLPHIIIPPNITHINTNASANDQEYYPPLILQGKVHFEHFVLQDNEYESYCALSKIYCLAAPPTIDNYSLADDTIFYYIDGKLSWEDLQAFEAQGFRRIIKLPAGSEIPSEPASNGSFANPIPLTGEKGQIVVNTTVGSTEEEEPYYPENSVWCYWTAPKSGMVQFNTFEADLDSTTDIFFSSSEEYYEIAKSKKIIFEVEEGKQYYVVVSGEEREWEGENVPKVAVLSWSYVIQDIQDGDFIYAVENNQATLVAYTGSEPELEIPDNFAGVPLVAIGAAAFAENYSLLEVVVPEGVNSIGEGAFWDCESLEKITLPDSLSNIGKEAFRWTGLEEITIPAAVTHIGSGAFRGCENLRVINLQEGLANIGSKAFAYAGLEAITIPDSVTNIGVEAFGGCWNLHTIELGQGLNKIESMTFADCEILETISIPKNIELIRREAFLMTYVINLVLQGEVTIEQDAFDWLTSIYCLAGPPILEADALPPVTIIYYLAGTPGWENVTTLRGHQVLVLPADSEIPLPSPVVSNDNFADALVITGAQGQINGDNTGCTREDGEPDEHGDASIWWKWTAPKDGRVMFDAFESFFDGENIVVVYEGDQLESLFRITNSEGYYQYPKKVDFWANEGEDYYIVFASSWGLARSKVKLVWFYEEDDFNEEDGFDNFIVDVNDGQATILRYLGSDSVVEIPEYFNGYPVTTIGAYSFLWQDHITEVTLPNTVTRIDEYAFAGCNLIKMSLPAGPISIASAALACRLRLVTIGGIASDFIFNFNDGQVSVFSYVGYDTVVVIPESFAGYPVTSIGGWAFSGFDLETIIIPDSVTSIGEGAFESSNLETIIIPDSVTSIGGWAFSGSNLETITIPDSVTSIGEEAFSECDRLRSVTFGKGLVSIAARAFSYSGLETVIIPDSVTSIGEEAFNGCYQLQSVTLGRGLTEIEPETFTECGIESIFIPENIKLIRQDAFLYCQQLTSITLEGVVRIKTNAFIVTDWDDEWFYDYVETPPNVYCLGGPPLLEPFSLPYGSILYYRNGQPGWENLSYLREYQVQNLAVASNPVIFIIGPQGIRNGGGELRQQVSYGQAAVPPEITASENWTFKGWDKDFSEVTKALFVSAQFEALKHKIVFKLGIAGEHSGGGELEQMLRHGATATAPDVTPREEAYTFIGWNQSFEQISEPLTVQARYSYEQSLSTGWNLIGSRLHLDQESRQELNERGAISLQPGGKVYVLDGNLAAGQACWIYCQTPETLLLSGTSPENYDLAANLSKGWNFIGALQDYILAGDDAVAWSWEENNLAPSEKMLAGQGYFLYWPDSQAEIIPSDNE